MTLDLVVLGLLIIVNILNHSPYIAQRWYVPTGIVGSALIVWIGYRAGVTLADIGLGPDSWIRGLIWSAGCIGAVTAVYVIGGSMTFTRRFLADDRAVLGPRTLLYKTLVNVPLGTVLFEELAFRGVGLALLSDWFPTWQAVLVSSLLFGFWHIMPSLVMHDANAAVGDLLGQGVWGRIQSVRVHGAGNGRGGGGVLRAADLQRLPAAAHGAALGDQRPGVHRRLVGAPAGRPDLIGPRDDRPAHLSQ